jgi:hypothetical protein
MTQEKALDFVCKEQNGDLSSLEKEITKEMVLQFELVGFITKGVNSMQSKTWRVTETAMSVYNSFYKKPNFFESLKGYYCHYILNF